MPELKIRRRHRLRQKEVEDIAAALNVSLGTQTFKSDDALQVAEIYGLEQKVYILGTEIVAMEIDGSPFLSITGILRYGATKAYVTVDMGAVKYVANGADVMGPGITDGDRSIVTGQTVWIREEKFLKPLAIGRCLVEGSMLGKKSPGKHVQSLFYVGDRVWKLQEELSKE